VLEKWQGLNETMWKLMPSVSGDKKVRHYVDYSQDHSLNMKGQFANVPLSKLVVGLANGWALSGDENRHFTSLLKSVVRPISVWKT